MTGAGDGVSLAIVIGLIVAAAVCWWGIDRIREAQQRRADDEVAARHRHYDNYSAAHNPKGKL